MDMISEEKTVNETAAPKKNNRTWRIVLIVAGILALVVVCTVMTELLFLPFAERLIINEATPTFTPVVQTPLATSPAAATTTTELPPTATVKASACTETGTMSFLILGVDMPSSSYPKGADAIRLVELDFNTMEATMIVVPRDLWVSTPVLNDQDFYSNRIGLTYYYAKQDVPAGNDETVYATTLLAQTLYDNFEFVPDHYITLHLDKFDDIVDALGGINVVVPEEYHSTSYVFPAGTLAMDGDQALEYASNLINDDTVWERLERQERVIDAIVEKLTNPTVVFSIPGLISEFGNAVTTDLSLSDMTDLACLADEMDAADITTIELESPYVSPVVDSDVLSPDTDMIRQLILDVFEN